MRSRFEGVHCPVRGDQICRIEIPKALEINRFEIEEEKWNFI